MKKLLIAVFALALAAPVSASVGVDFGVNWYKVNYTYNVGEHLMGQGQNMTVAWGLDNDLTVGAYLENDVLSDNDGNSYTNELLGIQLVKGIVKNVGFGLTLGQGNNELLDIWGGGPITFTDVFAVVTVLSGASEKVSGSVKATVAGRFCRDVDTGNDYDMSGLVINLSVGLAF